MTQLERIGVSLDKELLSMFDYLIGKRGYQSRSEALRDLVRRELSEEQLSDPKSKGVAAVFLVYYHHSTKLTDKLIALPKIVILAGIVMNILEITVLSQMLETDG